MCIQLGEHHRQKQTRIGMKVHLPNCCLWQNQSLRENWNLIVGHAQWKSTNCLPLLLGIGNWAQKHLHDVITTISITDLHTVVRKSVGYIFQIMLTPYFNHWALFIMLRWQTVSNDRHLVHNVKEWDNIDRLGIENRGQTFQLTVLINSNISMIAELNKLYLSPLARKASQTAFKWLFCTMCRLYVSSLRFINLRKNRTAPASKK